MNRALPSGAALAETLHNKKAIAKMNALWESLRNIGLNDSGTGINLKINFPYIKAWAKLQHNPENLYTLSLVFNVSILFVWAFKPTVYIRIVNNNTSFILIICCIF